MYEITVQGLSRQFIETLIEVLEPSSSARDRLRAAYCNISVISSLRLKVTEGQLLLLLIARVNRSDFAEIRLSNVAKIHSANLVDLTA